MIVSLPWPSKKLSANARGHSRWQAKAKAQARTDATYATFAAFQGGAREARFAFCGDHPIPLTITITPPDRRRRDRDNMQFMCSKCYLDGVSDALGVNDVRFRPQYVFNEPKFPGEVLIAFEVINSFRAGANLDNGRGTDTKEDRPTQEAV